MAEDTYWDGGRGVRRTRTGVIAGAMAGASLGTVLGALLVSGGGVTAPLFGALIGATAGARMGRREAARIDIDDWEPLGDAAPHRPHVGMHTPDAT